LRSWPETLSQEDAAFIVGPYTALGVSKAAGDVLTLRRDLSAERDLSAKRDLGAALSLYEGERLPIGDKIAANGRRLGETALRSVLRQPRNLHDSLLHSFV
jgi:2-polyprenyl-6-methoxyphenol hydroxylase-like FAD-dependent oxidoreductase